MTDKLNAETTEKRIWISPTVSPCFNYTSDETDKKKKKNKTYIILKTIPPSVELHFNKGINVLEGTLKYSMILVYVFE